MTYNEIAKYEERLATMIATVKAHDDLLFQAGEIVDALGIRVDPAFDNSSVLWINEQSVTIGYPENDSYEPSMGWQNTVSFPVHLLVATGAEREALIEACLAAQRKAEEARYAADRAEAIARTAQAERETYERLKAKFDHP